MGARAFIPVALAGAVLFTLAPTTPASAAITTEGQQIVQIAKRQIGDPWRYGASGPYAFDCSGLVIYAYKKAGDGATIRSGTLRSARSLYLYFKARGKTNRTNPRIGDLVIWGRLARRHLHRRREGHQHAPERRPCPRRVRRHRTFTAYIHTGMSTTLR